MENNMSNNKKKILIYMQTSELAPVGGPRGYVYNLKQELDKISGTNIYFIENGRSTINKYKNKIESMNKSKIKDILIIIKSIIKHFMLLYCPRHRALVDLNQYDLVHFHTTLDMYNVRESLKNYNGIVLLSSHSPTLLSSEIYDSRSPFEKKYFGFIYNNLIKVDEYAFRRADYLIFPCPDAEEPYYNNWSNYRKIKELKENNFRYILTGIKPCNVKLSKNEVRHKYNIPDDAFVICYVGRHNMIKGYDILKEIGERLLENPRIYFLVAGRETPLKGLKHKRWIEVGWTNDPHSLIAASDVFILPNRETYFDLIMLEVLSIGQIIIASNTGGNKFFKDNIGVFLYDNTHDIEKYIYNIFNMTEKESETLKLSNKELFEENFTCEKFARNYISVYKNLI